MSCDQHFERCLQNKFDTLSGAGNKPGSHHEVAAAPHRLIGNEIWAETEGREVLFLEGVTGIEFRDGMILFQTVLGETLSIQGALARVTLREEGVILQAKGEFTAGLR
jgi:hypothetical protein